MTSLFTINLLRNSVVDIFDTIPDGAGGYIQNISNREVQLSDTSGFESYLVLGGRVNQPTISSLIFEAGDSVFLKTLDRKAKVTIAVEVDDV